MPRSEISTLVPPPSRVTGISDAAAAPSTLASDSSSAGSNRRSAGPPMRNDVKGASGSSAAMRPLPSAANEASAAVALGRSRRSVSTSAFELGENLGTQLGDVAGAERQDDVTGPREIGDRRGEIAALGLIGDRAPMPPRHLFGQMLAARVFDRSLAGGVDVGDDDDVGRVERTG